MEVTLFSSLSGNNIRKDLLMLLKKESLSKQDLAHKTKISDSSVDKGLNHLLGLGFLDECDQVFSLNEHGRVFLQKASFFEFVSTHSNYFLNHNIDECSRLNSFECISSCKLVEGTFPTTTRMKNIVNNAEKFLYCIFTHPPFLLADAILDKISGKIDLFLLFGKNSSVPDCNDLVEKLELNKPKQHKFKKRIAEHVQTNIVASEKQACLMLPYSNGITDMDNSLVGEDEKFVRWCQEFFHNNGIQVSRLQD